MNPLSLIWCQGLGRHLIESVSFGGNPVTYGREFVCIHILFKYTLIIFPVVLASFPGERRGRCSPTIAQLPPRDAHGHTNLVRPIRPINPAEEISSHASWVSLPIISSDLGCFWQVFWQEHCFPKLSLPDCHIGELEVKEHLPINSSPWDGLASLACGFNKPFLCSCPSFSLAGSPGVGSSHSFMLLMKRQLRLSLEALRIYIGYQLKTPPSVVSLLGFN